MILKILKIMVSTRSEGTRQVKLAISVHYLVTSIDGEDIPFIKIQIYIYILQMYLPLNKYVILDLREYSHISNSHMMSYGFNLQKQKSCK